MSDDDDFGDFAEADAPQIPDVQVDSSGRPLNLLPSVQTK